MSFPRQKATAELTCWKRRRTCPAPQPRGSDQSWAGGRRGNARGAGCRVLRLDSPARVCAPVPWLRSPGADATVRTAFPSCLFTTCPADLVTISGEGGNSRTSRPQGCVVSGCVVRGRRPTQTQHARPPPAPFSGVIGGCRHGPTWVSGVSPQTEVLLGQKPVLRISTERRHGRAGPC